METLCDYLHLSPAYFSTLFKRETGMSFTSYVTTVRMEKAAELLKNTDDKTYRIAELIGFSDPNYFSYVFKKYYGVTPTKFRGN
ncbi:MAG: helix-turn-helix transcriptional regulator [Clostridia bacterium]|nr:helix-turn-helix transcriptional regulator [Clostridia bacterium]